MGQKWPVNPRTTDASVFYPNVDPNTGKIDTTIATSICVLSTDGTTAAWTTPNGGLKQHWDKDPAHSGYCALASQCWDYEQDNNKGFCYDDKNFTQDHYCNAGSWTSRTSIVAQDLASLVPSGHDYTLFCDSPQYVLNSPTSDFAADASKVNNFCALRYVLGSTTQVVLGTSFNALTVDSFIGNPVVAPGYLNSFVIDKTAIYQHDVCLNNGDPSTYYETLSYCGDDHPDNNGISYYYDNTSKVFLFSETDTELLPSPPSPYENVKNWLVNFLGNTGTTSPEQQNVINILGMQSFNRIYLQRTSDASSNSVYVSGYMDTRANVGTYSAPKRALVVEYQNLNANLAPIMKSAVGGNLGYSFTSETGPPGYQRVFFMDEEASQSIEDLWLAMTAQLRIRPEAYNPKTGK